MSTHEQILELVENYKSEHEKFETKGVKAASSRARKALADLSKAIKVRRTEIQDKKNAMSAK
jgi:hypothetical protein